jgi:pyruvate formate lyase activating enzyme
VILGNLKLCAESGVDITIRIPLIPEYNNSAENIEATAKLVRDIAPEAKISVLPYHKYGESKYRSVGMTYALSDLRENTPEELERTEQIFKAHGFECEISK